MKHNKKAFTLVELLVVVLIIGILSAIAIPMYQGAVDKSHWSTMLPASKAIKDAEEAFKMTNGEYSDTMEHLDVQISNDELTFTLNTPNNMSEPNVIKVTNIKLDNVRLASYLDDSPLFAGQLHCEAKNEGSTPNARGQRLCEKLLNGQELNTEGGYTRYLLDQSITKEICGDANLVWSNKNTKCFKTEKDRCEANGMPYSNGFCGCKESYTGGCSNSTFDDGASCVTNAGGWAGCTNNYFDEGSCTGNTGDSCSGTFTNNSVCTAKAAHACSGTYSSGSVCIGINNYSCHAATFKEGSKCVAHNTLTCGGLYKDVTYDGGCCEEGVPGQTNCPSYAPKC